MDLNQLWDDVDTDAIEADAGRSAVSEPIPPGEYRLQLVAEEMKETKKGTGVMFVCQFKVVDGEHENRVVFHQFNVRNQSAQAQQIGISQFKAFCLATAVEFNTARADTESLMYVPFQAEVGLSKTTLDYPNPRNEIKRFISAGGVVPASKKPTIAAAKPAPVAARPAPAAARAPAFNGGSLPWKPKPATDDQIPF